MSITSLRVLSLLMFVAYFGTEYFHWFPVEAISPYGIYFFEVIWVFITWLAFRRFVLLGKYPVLQKTAIAALLPMGWLVHFFARKQQMIIPFDFTNSETVLFLILIGPLLEEFVFRGAFWRLTEVWTQKLIVPVIVTTLLFSASHFQALTFVPEEYKNFIVYQGLYTLVLGFFCANLRMRSGLLAAILGHVCFNFGFWLAR